MSLLLLALTPELLQNEDPLLLLQPSAEVDSSSSNSSSSSSSRETEALLSIEFILKPVIDALASKIMYEQGFRV